MTLRWSMIGRKSPSWCCQCHGLKWVWLDRSNHQLCWKILPPDCPVNIGKFLDRGKVFRVDEGLQWSKKVPSVWRITRVSKNNSPHSKPRTKTFVMRSRVVELCLRAISVPIAKKPNHRLSINWASSLKRLPSFYMQNVQRRAQTIHRRPQMWKSVWTLHYIFFKRV